MSTFSKKYFAPKNTGNYLILTWETGYRNVQVFDGQRLVTTISSPARLIKGVEIDDPELGKIKLIFTTVGPKKIEVRVNRKKYKTQNNTKLSYDYTGLIAMFTTLAVLAAMGQVIFLGMLGFDFSFPLVPVVFVIDLVIITIYGVTSYLLSKRKPWAYFIGTSVFLLTTIFESLGNSFILNESYIFLPLVFRYGFLIYILSQIRHILKEMRNSQDTNITEELLDSEV